MNIIMLLIDTLTLLLFTCCAIGLMALIAWIIERISE
jgi:hypothetical protein